MDMRMDMASIIVHTETERERESEPVSSIPLWGGVTCIYCVIVIISMLVPNKNY